MSMIYKLVDIMLTTVSIIICTSYVENGAIGQCLIVYRERTQ